MTISAHRFPRPINAYMRYARAKYTYRREKRRLDARVARAMKRLQRLPADDPRCARWLEISEKAMGRLARLQMEVKLCKKEVEIRQGGRK